MQQIYELSLTPTYVSDWDFKMAIRELIQNGIDQQTTNSKCTFSMEFVPNENDSTKGKILFTSKQSRLKVNTLLLGCTSKEDDTLTVGQFGEGYKIASLVLNRLGKTFVVHNNMENEIWVARFKNSKKWRGKILAFFVDKVDQIDSNDLVIEVGNVTDDEYSLLQEIWLGYEADDSYEKIETSYGEILLDNWAKGEVYVNGLYIECHSQFKYGYNFKPEYLRLERDRKSCDSWLAQNLTAKMVSEAMINGDMEIETVHSMIEEDLDDVTNINYCSYEQKQNVVDSLKEVFDEQHDKGSIPVTDQSDYDMICNMGGTPIFVPRSVGRLLSDVKEERIDKLVNSAKQKAVTPREKLQCWYDQYCDRLSSDAKEELKEIINML